MIGIEGDTMKDLNKPGALSAFYLAAAYLTGIVIFLFILDYPSITSPSQKMQLLVNNGPMLYLTNILMYVLFGPALIILALSLYDRLKSSSRLFAQAATAIAVVWAGALVASGMVANSGISTVLELYKSDPAQATMMWTGIEAVANGLGGANGEILGGLMTLLFSIAAIKSGNFSKQLNYLGIITGVIGLVSTVPGLKDFAGLFGISQMVWFVWTGVHLMKSTTEQTF